MSLEAKGPDLDGLLPKKVFWVFSRTACLRDAFYRLRLKSAPAPLDAAAREGLNSPSKPVRGWQEQTALNPGV